MKSKFMSMLAIAGLLLCASAAQGQVIYDSTVTPLPGNLPSVGGEAYAFNELGDAINFAGTARNLRTVSVTMSSWGCQAGHWYAADCVTSPGATFNVDITLNIYGAGNPAPGALITSKTQTFAIPYRPSSDNTNCTAGRWYKVSTGQCFNGLANNITFDLSALNVALPNSVVYGVVYNTSHYGPAPVGESAACYTSAGGCGYDSMNIALSSLVVTGSKATVLGTLYQNSPLGLEYCDNGLAGTGSFRLDSPTSACWFDDSANPYIPTARFAAAANPMATSTAGCKNNGWQSVSRFDGSLFKNQGDCIQYVNTGK